jgi:hypothetical protein
LSPDQALSAGLLLGFQQVQEAFMGEQRANGTPVVNAANPQSSGAIHREGRNMWILTIYGISGLTVFGVLAYYFSSYIVR